MTPSGRLICAAMLWSLALASCARPTVRAATGDLDADVWIVRSCGSYRVIIKRLCNPEHCRTNAFLQSGVGSTDRAIYPINEVNEHVGAFVRNVAVERGGSGCLFLLTVDESHSEERLFTLSLRPGTGGYLASPVNPALTMPIGGLLSFAEESSLPQWVLPALRVSQDIVPCACLNPFYQRADFDGDGRTDYAVLVKETISGKRGIAIVHRGSQWVHVLGAGKAIGNGGDDFDWMDAWRVFDLGSVH